VELRLRGSLRNTELAAALGHEVVLTTHARLVDGPGEPVGINCVLHALGRSRDQHLHVHESLVGQDLWPAPRMAAERLDDNSHEKLLGLLKAVDLESEVIPWRHRFKGSDRSDELSGQMR
jgi:hypothetical protein